jgi:hypothetical protein
MWETAVEARASISFEDCLWESAKPIAQLMGGILLIALAWILVSGDNLPANAIDRLAPPVVVFLGGVVVIQIGLNSVIGTYRTVRRGVLTTGVVTKVLYLPTNRVTFCFIVNGAKHQKEFNTSTNYPIGARVIVVYPPKVPREGRCIDNLIGYPF